MILFRDLPLRSYSIKWWKTMAFSQERLSPPWRLAPGVVERKGGHMGPIYKRGYGEAPRFQCIHLQLKACIWGILESLIRASLVCRRASTRFIDLSRARWLVKMVVHFFPLSSLSWCKWDLYGKSPMWSDWEKNAQVIYPLALHRRSNQSNQSNLFHHVTPSSSHKLVIEHGMYNCNFLVVLFRSAGALEWSLNLFDSS